MLPTDNNPYVSAARFHQRIGRIKERGGFRSDAMTTDRDRAEMRALCDLFRQSMREDRWRIGRAYSCRFASALLTDLVPLRRRYLEFLDGGLDRIVIVFRLDDSEILVLGTEIYTHLSPRLKILIF
jgi:hypothetical protein